MTQTPPAVIPPVVTPPTGTMTGTAAQGAPIAKGILTVVCASGAKLTGTTDEKGKWSIDLYGQTFPCLVSISGGSLPEGISLRSIAASEKNTNVTPLTDLIIASAAGASSAALGSGDITALLATVARLPEAQTKIFAYLVASGYATPEDLSEPFTAAFEPVAGNPYDDLIASITQSVADSGLSYDQLLESIAADTPVPMPLTTVISNSALSAIPQFNKASLHASNGVLSMALGAGDSPRGTYVGGGAGNKAILQLPGLNGMKLSEFKGMTLELQADNTATGANPDRAHVFLNLVIDLHCDAAPLPLNATLAQARARHRTLIFDPAWTFMRQTPLISASSFSTISFSPATEGWRASSGTSLGDGVDTGNITEGKGTLTGFNFATYPNACIVEGISGDAGMYRDTQNPVCVTDAALTDSDPALCGLPHGGASIGLGGSSITEAMTWQIKSVQYQGANVKSYKFE